MSVIFEDDRSAASTRRPRRVVFEEAKAAPPAPPTMASMQGAFEQLKSEAGPRGFTFAGRHVSAPDPLQNLSPPFSIDPKVALPPGLPRSPQFSIIGPGSETPEDVLARVPLGELESGGLATTGAMDLAAGLALGRGAANLAAHPREIIAGVKRLTSGFSARYEELVDRLGESIMSKVPKVFRAGRGTPLEFREARALMESDIANGVETALELGTPLTRQLSTSEKLRADQILRGGIVTGRTPPKVAEFTGPARRELDRLQDELLNLGKLSPETVKRFENNFGPYFARLYAKKEFVPKDPVLPFGHPVRAGTDRLRMRGERVEVEIPDLQDEMRAVSRLIGPEKNFRQAFREAAKEEGYKGRQVTEKVKETERVLSSTSTSATQTSTQTTQGGGQGTFTEVPLSGVAQRLEKVVTDALQTRGMTGPEAAAAVGRVKAAAVKAAEGGPEVKITGGGTTHEKVTERVTETIKQETIKQREVVKNIIDGLGVNAAQRSALHAYYDAISRAGAKAKRIKIGDKTYRIDPVMDVDSGLERAAALKPLLDDGYKLESRQGNKVTLFRDIPEAVRKEMGELRDQPGFVTAKSVAQLNREVAVNKFFNSVARNPEWTTDVAKTGFTQMGDSKTTLGELADKFVRSDIATELNEITRIKADWEKITSSLTQMWKVGKVSNPATIGRNIMSSAMMADWGGLSPMRPSGLRSYATTAAGFLGSDNQAVKLLAQAKAGGLFRSSFNQQEIANLAEGFLASKDDNGIIRLIDGTRQAISKVGEKFGHPTRFYGAVDSFFKGALYVHARTEMGLNPRMAVRFAKKYGIDYQDISPAVRFLREFPLGAPFATFASKAIPLSIETAVKHPIRFWKWPLGLMGISELSSRAFEAERSDLEKAQDLGEVASPRFVALPVKDKDGRFQFLDLGYILPFGDILESMDRLQGRGGSNIAFEIPGGPAKSLLEVSFNRNDFTEKPIYAETDTLGEASGKIADHLLKSWLPSLAPPIPFTGFTGGHSIEALRKVTVPHLQLPGEAPLSPTDYAGRQRSLGTTLASKAMGLNIKSVDPGEAARFKVVELERRIRELSSQIVTVQRSGITDEQKEAKISALTDKIKGIAESVRGRLGRYSGEVAGAEEPQPRSRRRVEFEQVAPLSSPPFEELR